MAAGHTCVSMTETMREVFKFVHSDAEMYTVLTHCSRAERDLLSYSVSELDISSEVVIQAPLLVNE